MILQTLIFNSHTYELGSLINNGDLSLLLLKPISISLYFLSQDLADKALNAFMLLLEIGLLLLFIHLPFHLPSLGLVLVWFLPLFILASLLYFALGFLFGLVGFWSRDVWAPRFLFLVFLEFATGALFPLDMLPKTWQIWLPFTPFPYLLFYPLKLFLGQLERPFFYLAMAFFWLLVLALLDLFIWHRGMRRYEAEGR